MLEMIRALEWDRFIELAQREARTVPGKVLLGQFTERTHWAEDIPAAQAMQQETIEITPLLDRDALWGPLVELPDITPLLNRLARGSILELGELVAIRSWLYAVDAWTQIPRDEIRGEKFRKILTQLPDPFNLLKILDRVLTPEGELSEGASPKLAALHREIRHLKKEIEVNLDQLLKQYSQKGILQENFTDVRDGRYVLPVKISFQSEIPGIIHEASASRQTVFVEPSEVTPLNNRLRQVQNNLIQEVFIILEMVCKSLEPFVKEIAEATTYLIHWDIVQAKARLARHYSGKPIHINEENTFFLQQTAHPLLWWSLPPEAITRNDIELNSSVKALLITGPNTGGKTVLLKTLGLASLCARTGFPFPATDHPSVPFFHSIFTDLGDPQSIEKHLSSFSGHVIKLKEILDQMTEHSLVLIDELNSATDPQEGAAFSRAIIETIIDSNATLITTTHDPQLKAIATSDSRIMNASMEFNEKLRTPTYRMVLGVPGRSRALETAERFGIPLRVIELARSYLSPEHKEMEKLLSKLESDLHETSRARREAVSIREEAEKLKTEWMTRMQSGIGEMTTRIRQKMRHVLEQAQDEVRAAVKKLDELKNRRDIDQTRTLVNETTNHAIDQLDEILSQEAPELNLTRHPHSSEIHSAFQRGSDKTAQLEVGATVRVAKWKTTGQVLELVGTKVKVGMGTLQMLIPVTEVELIEKPLDRKNLQAKTQFTSTDSSPPRAEIDLRGLRFDEAMSQLGSYLDSAYRSGAFVEVTIVHGLGSGALREGARKLLKNLPYVKTFRDGGAGHGGSGATLIEFER